jgi:hypothetical protein
MVAVQPSLRDFGNSKLFPALKCRAIVIASLRDCQTPLAPKRPDQNEWRKRAVTSANCELRIAECAASPPSFFVAADVNSAPSKHRPQNYEPIHIGCHQ